MFRAMDGVLGTEVGYTGGDEPWPTYGSMKDHTECVQLEYDPAVLSFEAIVGRILESGGRNRCVGRQIMSGVWSSAETKLFRNMRRVRRTRGGRVDAVG